MRKRTSVTVAVATLAGATGFLFQMGSATAQWCPPRTNPVTIYVAGHPVGACFPSKPPPCDPKCDPTAAPVD